MKEKSLKTILITMDLEIDFPYINYNYNSLINIYIN